MKFRTSWDQGWAGEKARVIKDLLQRHWHLNSVGLGNCRAAKAIERGLNEHHPVAQSAVRGDPRYNFRKALAIPNEELARLGAKHRLISVAQRRLYVAFRKTGQKLDWDSIEKIETEALMRGGVKSETAAKAVVKRAITALKTDGVKPRRIPWGD